MLSGLKDIIFGVRKKRIYPKLVTFGNVLVDFSFSIESNNQILKKYDFDSDVLGECTSEKLANVLRDAQETCVFLNSQPGGSALNTSKILSMLGEMNIVFCGMIGADSNGELIQKKLANCHLNVCLQVHPIQPTGACVCLVNKENRCCYANIGASIYFQKKLLQDKVPELTHAPPPTSPTVNALPPTTLALMPQQIFYVEGFFVTGERFPVCKYIYEELCRKSNNGYKIMASNLSAVYMIEDYPTEMKYLAEHSSILFGNIDEFRKLAEIYQIAEVEDLIYHLITVPKTSRGKVVICTRGPESVFYSCAGDGSDGTLMERNDKTEMYLNREYMFQPVSPEKVVDTTGCGDAFVAGFLFAYLRGESIGTCVAKGVEVASSKIIYVGGSLIPTRNEIKRL